MRLRIASTVFCMSLACTSGPLKLGDRCIASPPDPCPAGLECRQFISIPSGYTQNACQFPFGSQDGGLGQACGTATFTPTDEEYRQSVLTDCGPFGLECDPSGVSGDGVTYSCQLPLPNGQCSMNTGCAFGYPCTPDPKGPGFNICVETCQTTAACTVPGDRCQLDDPSYGCYQTRSEDFPNAVCCSPVSCGPAANNGRAFTACDNADAGDGTCYPDDVYGNGLCEVTGNQPQGAPCFGRSAFACQSGLICINGIPFSGAPSACVAVCAMPGTPIATALDGGPTCPEGQACTRALSSTTPTGVCAPLCGTGKAACAENLSCQQIENGNDGCLPGGYRI